MMDNYLNLSNKTIAVTGASSGIGKAAAQMLSRFGSKVVLISRNSQRLKAVWKSLAGNGHSYYDYDLSKCDGIIELVKMITDEQGPLDGLFHAAGVSFMSPLSILKEKHLDPVIDINLGATLMLAKAFCLKGVRRQGDTSLVFMSSVAGLRGQQGLSVYSACKAAVDGAVRSLAVELAPRQIRVNSIAAGAVETEMHERIIKNLSEEAVENYRKKHLLGFGSPEDVANAAIFLLSVASKWVTGTTLVVDGGYCCF
jgi:NAD(P)-dependent dehydrogenase (short-subunit alcohol dehydrogenase family)